MASAGLVHQWVVAGMVSAAARFIPVPLVDDFVRDRSRQYAVSQTLKAHGRQYASKQLAAYYGNPQGCLAGCVSFGLWLPVRLILFPIRKLMALLTAVHGVPMDLLKTVLLARTLDRCLERGMLADEASVAEREQQTLQIRRAFEEAMQGMDWLVVKTAIRDALKHSAGWRQAAANLATRAFRSDQVPEQKLPEDEQLEQGAEHVEAVLQRPETLALLQRFDERFDATLSP
ncbi:hypothetical protein [Roseimaritima ulvae]|uniref:Uncharacterized protein n=1 Tax=Roseimaritima ulvae TaxID=980254 RepID=A0A5B9R105_9BACT|nr:hypothetical protein [Roseimaritima ulvae]QEG39963.1 hypothetical protein UC8_19660 [Roseimaritima ulvae]